MVLIVGCQNMERPTKDGGSFPHVGTELFAHFLPTPPRHGSKMLAANEQIEKDKKKTKKRRNPFGNENARSDKRKNEKKKRKSKSGKKQEECLALERLTRAFQRWNSQIPFLLQLEKLHPRQNWNLPTGATEKQQILKLLFDFGSEILSNCQTILNEALQHYPIELPPTWQKWHFATKLHWLVKALEIVYRDKLVVKKESELVVAVSSNSLTCEQSKNYLKALENVAKSSLS